MSLSSLIKSANSGFLKTVLAGAGISLATSSISYIAFQSAVNSIKNQASSVSGDILLIMHIAGLDVFMSSILGAVATYFALSASKLSLRRK